MKQNKDETIKRIERRYGIDLGVRTLVEFADKYGLQSIKRLLRLRRSKPQDK